MSNPRSFNFIDPGRVRGPSIDDICRVMKPGSLLDAYTEFKKNCAKYQPYSVLIFPGITDFGDMQFENIDIEKYFAKLRTENDMLPHVNVERLRKIVDDVYIIEEVPAQEEDINMKLKEMIKSKPSSHVKKEEEWNYCLKIIDHLFSNCNVQYAYIRDIVGAPEETGNMLENFRSHISIEENPDLQVMPGINCSMHYIGEKGSFTPFHIEDGGLSSINLLKGGGPKVWIIIPYNFQAEVEACFTDYLRSKEQSKAQSCKKQVDICKDILQHKSFLITPKLLTEWNVPYSIIVQRPGDLFFIRTGTYHAVINAEQNIAEAINFGCDQWSCSYQPVPCNCIGNLRTEVQQDRRVIISYRRSKRKMYKCDFGCEELFLTKQKLKKHEQVIHKVVLTCAECSAVFNARRSLVKHIHTHFTEKVKKECDMCKKKVVDLNQHKRRVHTKLKQCEKCKKEFYAHTIQKHKENCMVVCSICRITCTNRRYLTQHIKRKHTNK